mmetsp:Transcript_3855/g.6530  ORF Transcript_3855/g.6530 Transcript_3855/m.6530 type:complete len:386 (-) Transcript_3855:139-1296(-)
MSKRKNNGVCLLDVKDLLKFDPSLHYFSACPACRELVSDHKDAGFRRQQLAELSAQMPEHTNEVDASVHHEEGVGSTTTLSRQKKKQKTVMSTTEAAVLVQQGKLCCTIGCSRRPVYNVKGLRARFCRLHKEDDMVNCKEKTCQHEGCDNAATYKQVGKKDCKKMCSLHMDEGMVKFSNCCRQCAADGCTKVPSYNNPGEKARFCTHHKEPGMINVFRKVCHVEGCNLAASFDAPGHQQARFCSVHRTAEMVNVKVTPCAHEGCRMKPYFNFRDQKQGKFCTQHKEEGMVNLLVLKTKRVCDHSGCEKCACFAFSKSDDVRYCATHKERDMIDVQNIVCEHEDCGKRPNFNFLGIKKGRFCSKHKEDGMVNVVNERRKEREGLAT